MAQPRIIAHAGEALVLRTWPFHEADLLVSLFTREHGRIKGVARHAMRSRRRFGGALEPMTHVRAHWTERPRRALALDGDLVRLDSFEIVSSPLAAPVDYTRLAALSFVAEVLDELPEGAVDDPTFRLALTLLPALATGSIALPVVYFALWMNRLQGWMPQLTHCVVCAEPLTGPAARPAFYSATADGLTCADDRRPGSLPLHTDTLADTARILRAPLAALVEEGWLPTHLAELRRFGIDTLERHLERRLHSTRALGRV